MIGKAGKSLQAFNRLVKAAVSAAFKKRIGLLIDVNGYKEERYEKSVKWQFASQKMYVVQK